MFLFMWVKEQLNGAAYMYVVDFVKPDEQLMTISSNMVPNPRMALTILINN